MQIASLLDDIFRSGLVCSTDGSTILPVEASVDQEVGALLQRLICERRPSVSLEIGLAYGVSALFICEAMMKSGGRRHIAIDPNQSTQWRGIGLNNLRKAGFGELVELREQESQIALPNMAGDGLQVDFAFIDGMHTFDHALVDFFYVDRLLRVGGVVAIDDVSFPSLQQLCRFIATNRAYRVCGASGSGVRLRPRFPVRMARWIARNSAEVAMAVILGKVRALEALRRRVKPQFGHPDEVNFFPEKCRCIAFEKLADDSRSWDFHCEF